MAFFLVYGVMLFSRSKENLIMSNTTFTEKKSIFESGLREGIWVKVFDRQEEPCIAFFKAVDDVIEYTDYTDPSYPARFFCPEVTAEPLERDPHICLTCNIVTVTDVDVQEAPDVSQIELSADVILIIDSK